METGASKGIEFSTLVRLCDFFKCAPGDLLFIDEEPEDIAPSEEAMRRAEELVARGLKAAMEAPVQTPEEIWAEFDAVCERLQQEASGTSARKRGLSKRA